MLVGTPCITHDENNIRQYLFILVAYWLFTMRTQVKDQDTATGLSRPSTGEIWADEMCSLLDACARLRSGRCAPDTSEW